MLVAVTRPRPDADDTAAELSARGHDPIVAPLLTVTIPSDATLDLDTVQAILITSANGARALAAATDRRDVPVFAVGHASAAAARGCGFDRTESADGDVAALAELVASRLSPRDGGLLHVAGSVTAGDLSGMLGSSGFTVRRAVAYRADPVTVLPPAMTAPLRSGTLGAVLFYSPRTAAQFVKLVAEDSLSEACVGVTAIALSQAVADKLAAVPFSDVRIAESPDQPSLLQALDGLNA
ncbi:MAG: uroporphyrinogen-III synthase [Alphaproteobacteria bacterium]